jgi:hypothetical protein
MEAARSLQTFHEFPESVTPWLAEWRQLWAGTDGRARHWLWPCVRFVLGQTYARTGTAPANARHAFDFRNVRVGRRRAEPLRRIRHKVWRAGGREDVHFLAGIALGHGLGIRWIPGDCDHRRDGDRESESAGKNNASSRTRVSRHCQDSTNAESSLHTFSAFAGNVSAAQIKRLGHIAAPQPFWRVYYGLELTSECGTGCGPSACCSSDRPMHWPELPPVHGMLSTSGSPPGEVTPTSGEFGTRSGVHSPVKVSSDSPPAHAAIVGAVLVGMATTATAGAAATATANPPARSSRTGSFKVGIVTLSVGLLNVRRPKLWRQRASASGEITLPRWKTPGHRQ